MRTKGRDKYQKQRWDDVHKEICRIVKIATKQRPLYGISGGEIVGETHVHRNTVREHLKSDSNFAHAQKGHDWVWQPDYGKIQARVQRIFLEMLRDGQAKIVSTIEAEKRMSEEQRRHIHPKNMVYVQVSEDEIIRRLKVKAEVLKEADEKGKDFKPRWIKADDFSSNSN